MGSFGSSDGSDGIDRRYGSGCSGCGYDGVVESNPAVNSTVNEIPRKISLTFSGVPQDGFNSIALTKDGKVITREKPHQDGKTLSIEVPEQKDAEPGSTPSATRSPVPMGTRPVAQ